MPRPPNTAGDMEVRINIHDFFTYFVPTENSNLFILF